MLRLEVKGKPVPHPRPRAARRGPGVHMYTPETGKEWREELKRAVTEAWKGAPTSDLLQLDVTFLLPRPASHLKRDGSLRKGAPEAPVGTRSGDVDNYLKSVMDAMNGIVYEDDSQVLRATATKAYTRGEGCALIYLVDYPPETED